MPLASATPFGAISPSGFGGYDGSGNGPIQTLLAPSVAARPYLSRHTDTSYSFAYSNGSSAIEGRAISRSGTTLTSGAAAAISGGAAALARPTSLPIDSSRVIMSWFQSGDSVRARVGTVTGTTLGSLGSITTVDSGNGNTESLAMCLLDTDKVLAAWGNAFGGAGNRTAAAVLSITGSSIAVNTKATDGDTANEASLVTLDSGRALLFNSDGADVVARVLSVSGTTVTFNSQTVVKAAAGSDSLKAVALDSSRVLVAYTDESNSNLGTVQVLSCPGTTVTTNTEFTFATITGNAPYDISADLVASDEVMLAYQDSAGDIESRVAFVSGTSVSFGTEVQLVGFGDNPQIRRTDGSTGAVALWQNGSSELDGVVIGN